MILRTKQEIYLKQNGINMKSSWYMKIEMWNEIQWKCTRKTKYNLKGTKQIAQSKENLFRYLKNIANINLA